MIKVRLTKTDSVGWLGNGFGYSTAEWCVKGLEHIQVRKLMDWTAIDSTTGKRIATGWTKKDLVETLERKLNQQ